MAVTEVVLMVEAMVVVVTMTTTMLVALVVVVVLTLVNVKTRYEWSDKNFSSLLQVVHNMLPKENTLPKTYYQAKNLLCPMGMKY